MKTLIIENTWSQSSPSKRGWGNGYVVIPKDSSLHGKDCDELNPYISVHGGLTCSKLIDSELIKAWGGELPQEIEGDWIVGFATANTGDNPEIWNKEAVQEETENLKVQLEMLEVSFKLHGLDKQIEAVKAMQLPIEREKTCIERLRKGAETYGEINFLKVDLLDEMQQEVDDLNNYIPLARLAQQIGFADQEELRKATLNLQAVLDRIKRGDDYDREDNYEFL